MQRLEVSGAVRLIYKSLGVKGLNTPYLIMGTKQTTRRRSVLKLAQIQIYPLPLNFLILPHWLSVKFHYSLIGSKVKILNTLTVLAAIYVTLFPLSNSYEPL